MKSSGTESFPPFIPLDVAHMVICENVPLFKAWRLRLGMSLEFIATAAGLSPKEVVKLDSQANGFSRPLMKAAGIMNLDFDQLVDVPS